jgi:hypothetical protein
MLSVLLPGHGRAGITCPTFSESFELATQTEQLLQLFCSDVAVTDYKKSRHARNETEWQPGFQSPCLSTMLPLWLQGSKYRPG